MPLLNLTTRTKASSGSSSLVLDASHSISVDDSLSGSSSDIFLSSNMEFLVSFVAKAVVHERDQLAVCYRIADCFSRVLRINAEALNIDNVSDAYTQDGRQPLSISISPRNAITSTAVDPDSQGRRLLSVSLVFTYTSDDEVVEPELFSSTVDRFLKFHIVRRYPFIFGPWCKKASSSNSYFQSIAASILRMLDRSPNDAFQKQVGRCLKSLKREYPEKKLSIPDKSVIILALCSVMKSGFLPPFSKLKESLAEFEGLREILFLDSPAPLKATHLLCAEEKDFFNLDERPFPPFQIPFSASVENVNVLSPPACQVFAIDGSAYESARETDLCLSDELDEDGLYESDFLSDERLEFCSPQDSGRWMLCDSDSDDLDDSQLGDKRFLSNCLEVMMHDTNQCAVALVQSSCYSGEDSLIIECDDQPELVASTSIPDAILFQSSLPSEDHNFELAMQSASFKLKDGPNCDSGLTDEDLDLCCYCDTDDEDRLDLL